MKLFCLISLFFAMTANASQSDLLKCLGKEEKYIHQQKIGGAFFELNKKMISFVVMFPNSTRVKTKKLKEVCEETFSSFHLLRLFLTDGKKVFTQNSEKKQGDDSTTAESLAKNSIQMFLEFLGKYQAQFKQADCLEKSIPELREFFRMTRYLETDMSYLKLVRELPNKDIIFDKILSRRVSRGC